MKRKLFALALIAAALAASNAIAASPIASIDRGWTEYTGTGAVGNNKVQDNGTAYWMFESSGTWMGQAVNSWFVFWDPKNSRTLSGSIQFDQEILFVHDQQHELDFSAGSGTGAFGKAGVSYDYSNKLVGLEALDRKNTSFSGDTLSLRWTASNPGDHIRVMTAVPEPSSVALLLAGLLGLGFMARRRVA